MTAREKAIEHCRQELGIDLLDGQADDLIDAILPLVRKRLRTLESKIQDREIRLRRRKKKQDFYVSVGNAIGYIFCIGGWSGIILLISKWIVQ